jgi:hypothetical protein
VHDEDTYVDLAFGESGEIVGADTATRVRGKTIQPWNGWFRDFAEFDGIRIPIRAEAWWKTPDGPFTYWRGEVTSFRRIE